MTVADVKIKLMSYKYTVYEINVCLNELREMREAYMKAFDYSREPIASGAIPDPTANYVCQVEEQLQLLRDKLSEKMQTYIQIYEMLDNLDDAKERAVLVARYIEDKSWDEIESAYPFKTSKRSCQSVHGSALANLAAKL